MNPSNLLRRIATEEGGLFGMGEDIQHILRVEKDSEDGLIVTFSDGTIAGYVVEELLLLRPNRERVKVPVASN